MLEIYLEQAWQNAFCYALAVEPPEKEWQGAKLLMTIIAGSDSTLQAMKAGVDIGSGGLSFGHGEKTLTEYKFVQQFRVLQQQTIVFSDQQVSPLNFRHCYPSRCGHQLAFISRSQAQRGSGSTTFTP